MRRLLERMRKIRASVVLWLNIAVGLVLIVVFSVSTLTVSVRLSAESDARIRRTLGHFRDVFEQETFAIRDMVFLCKSETAFVRTVNSRTSAWADISEYVTQTIHTLSIMQNAYDYVDGVYLYAPSVNRMIGASGTIDIDYYEYIEWIQKRLSSSERFDSPFELKEGWNSFKNLAIYTATVPVSGRLLVLVSPERLAELDGFGALYPGQHMVVLDSQGGYFASSLSKMDETLRALDWTDAQGDSVSLEGKAYHVERLESAQFSYLLLTNIDTYEREYRRIAALSVGLCAAGLTLLIALMLVNSSFSQAISRSFGLWRRCDDSEIDQIARMMLENDQFRRRELGEMMRLLLEEKQNGVPEQMAELVTESFERFMAVCLAAQSADGALEDGQMDALIQFVEDNINSCGVRSGECRVYFLIEAQPGTSIEQAVQQYFDTLPGDLCVYMGTSGVYTNPHAVQAAMRQAQRRMLCALVPADGRRYAFSRSETAHASAFDESVAAQVAERIMGGAADAAAALLRETIEEGNGRLYALRSWASMLRAQIASRGGVIEDETDDFYHPDYIVRKIAEHAEEAPAEPVHDEFRERVLAYMKAHYTEDITLESVAERFHVTAVHLSRWFKKANDINFSAYLSALRMNRACALLHDNPDMKIADLSLSVGIQNAATLTRQFKSFTGVTPEQFRRQCAMEDEKAP